MCVSTVCRNRFLDVVEKVMILIKTVGAGSVPAIQFDLFFRGHAWRRAPPARTWGGYYFQLFYKGGFMLKSKLSHVLLILFLIFLIPALTVSAGTIELPRTGQTSCYD